MQCIIGNCLISIIWESSVILNLKNMTKRQIENDPAIMMVLLVSQ